MLSLSRVDFALDLFNGVGAMMTRKMFGGMGIYKDGQIFAIIMSDEKIAIKGQGAMMEKFEALGMERWTYQKPDGKVTSMPYWAITDAMMDEPEEVTALASEAIGYL